jgi:GNAT superfamily N-acetyltransferase
MPYTIHRYPAELIDVVRGSAGERIVIRPVLPQDAELMQDFVRGLSAESRRNRFFRTLHELPAALLDRFTSIDYHDHLALLASVLADGEEVVIGEARYVVSEPGVAEFAVAVADGWQGRGIGRYLLARLECRARAEGITQLFGEVLPSNRPMHRLARSLGLALVRRGDGEGLWRVEKRLDPLPAASPCVDMAAIGGELVARAQ